MKLEQVKDFVRNQTKNYRVADILDKFDDSEWVQLYEQISCTKPWEVERRLIDYARYELDFFRHVLYKERHYEDRLIDLACMECLRCSDLCWQELRHHARKPRS